MNQETDIMLDTLQDWFSELTLEEKKNLWRMWRDDKKFKFDKEAEAEQDYMEGKNMCECGGELGQISAGDESATHCKECGSIKSVFIDYSKDLIK